MKDKIKDFVQKNKKYLVVLLVGLVLILIGYIYWDVYLSKIEIFKKEEKQLQEAAERYYSFRKQYLPKEGGYKTITLNELYENVEMEDLYVPKTKKVCSPDSWVKVYNEKGKYKYITYLECGKYKSKIDHEGPKITLNGNDVFYVAFGSKYEELGVKEVVDDEDGQMDIKDVIIDSSNVNTSQIGEYVVTYTAHDSTYNETKVTRKIVVSKGLSDTAKKNVNSEGYYQGISNNYVLFSGMLWRIVKVNENGTVKIILDQPSSNLRVNYEKYEDGNIDAWLNEYFYKHLTNPDDYVVESEFCVGNINSMTDISNYCGEKVKRKVGLLDVNEYYKTSNDGGAHYSIIAKSSVLGNKIGNNYANATFDGSSPSGETIEKIAPVRPVIVLVNNLTITSGDGSKDKPYKLNDYEYADAWDEINTRIAGEYFEYSGNIFRIIEIDKDSNVRAIMANHWVRQPDNTPIYVDYTDLETTTFDVKEDNNPGYIINNEFLDYMNTKNIITSTYEIPTNDPTKKYNEYETKKIKAKIVLPRTYDLFASQSQMMQSYIDNSIYGNMVFMVNPSTSVAFEVPKDAYQEYAIKAVMTIDGKLKIKSGNGTSIKPYKLGK